MSANYLKNGLRLSTFLILIFASLVSWAAKPELPLDGKPGLPLVATELYSGQTKSYGVSKEKPRGVVVVFLSAVCPCSFSHNQPLNQLAEKYPQFQFVAVHSNTDEGVVMAKTYFTDNKMTFPVIQDRNAELADRYQALKTPHAFILGPKGEILYQGGVSSSHNFATADHQYLRDALEDLQHDRPVKVASARTLGCEITRGASGGL